MDEKKKTQTGAKKMKIKRQEVERVERKMREIEE